MNISGLFRRFWAYYFDTIIVGGIFSVVCLVLRMFGIDAMILYFQGFLEQDYSMLAIIFLTYALVFFIYEAAFLSSRLSATPGKLILGLEVIGEKVSIFKVLIRSFIKSIATMTSIPAFILFLIAASNEKRQSLHDMMAGTYVVSNKSKKGSVSRRINNEELFEEMRRRGLKTYSEQVALANELYGGGRKVTTSGTSYAWVGIMILVISLVCTFSYATLYTKDLVEYAIKASVMYPRFKENGLQVEESLASKYVGSWANNDRTAGFIVYYDNKTGTMYINSSKRAFKFRFDSNNTLYVTDGNNNEFKITLSSNSDDAIYMTRPLNNQLEIKILLHREYSPIAK